MATKAYYIAGHGSDHHPAIPTFVVPPGCTIVVLAHRGQAILTTPGKGIMTKFCSLHPGIVKNPITFNGELTAAFLPWGSLAFYQEGDICPNFLYELRACYGTIDDPTSEIPFRCERYGSGVLDLDLIHENGCKALGDTIDTLEDIDIGLLAFDESEHMDDLDMFFDAQVNRIVAKTEAQFQYSVYPSLEWVKYKINSPEAKSLIRKVYTDIFKKKSPDETIFDNSAYQKAFTAALDYLDSKYDSNDMTQKRLCSWRPGVYYNFVCRMDEAGNIYTLLPSITRAKTVRDPNISWASASKEQKNLMKNHLSEALLRRKPAIRNLYEGKKFRYTRSTRRNFNHLSTVKSARATARKNRGSSKK